jgi:hypothetical protein
MQRLIVGSSFASSAVDGFKPTNATVPAPSSSRVSA